MYHVQTTQLVGNIRYENNIIWYSLPRYIILYYNLIYGRLVPSSQRSTPLIAIYLCKESANNNHLQFVTD